MIFEPSSNTPEVLRRKPTVLTVSLSTLPPLLIHINLPSYYPLHVSPQITSVRATHVWLPDAASLSSLLLNLWQTGEPALYNWIEYIRTGEFLEKLLIARPNSDFISCVELL
jgi:E3 ubiquitin-protein ligase RNF14